MVGNEGLPGLEVVLEDDLEDSKEEAPVSGALEEALGLDMGGDAGAGSPSQDPFSTSPRAVTNSPFGKDEVDLLEGRFDALSTSPGVKIGEGVESRPYLDELATTQIGPDISEALDLVSNESIAGSTSPEVKSPNVIEVEVSSGDAKPRQVVVPIHVTLDPGAEEAEFRVALHIKVRRKKS